MGRGLETGEQDGALDGKLAEAERDWLLQGPGWHPTDTVGSYWRDTTQPAVGLPAAVKRLGRERELAGFQGERLLKGCVTILIGGFKDA